MRIQRRTNDLKRNLSILMIYICRRTALWRQHLARGHWTPGYMINLENVNGVRVIVHCG
jgi:hypothetical protein